MDTLLAIVALIVIGVVLGLWVRALASLFASTLSSNEKLLWAVVLIAAPVLGLLVFLYLDPVGRRRATLA